MTYEHGKDKTELTRIEDWETDTGFGLGVYPLL